VATRKNRPVLFEVFSRSQRARGRGVTQRPAATPAEAAPGRAAAPPRGEPSGGTAPRSERARTERGRLVLTLGWPHLAVVLVGAVVVLAAVFQAGRRSARPAAEGQAALDEIMGASATVPTPPVEPARTAMAAPTPGQGRASGPVATPSGPSVEENATKAPPPPVRPAPTPKPTEAQEDYAFTAGAYYVVVQHFRTRDRELALAAQQFLMSKRVACVVRKGGGDLELVATEAFTSERAAQELVRRVVEFGKEYRAGGGGYDFAQAKARKF